MHRKNKHPATTSPDFYDALCRVSPLLHAFAKKGTKPVPYVGEAYALTEKQVEFKAEEKAKKIHDKGKSLLEGFMLRHNKKFEGK